MCAARRTEDAKVLNSERLDDASTKDAKVSSGSEQRWIASGGFVFLKSQEIDYALFPHPVQGAQR